MVHGNSTIKPNPKSILKCSIAAAEFQKYEEEEEKRTQKILMKSLILNRLIKKRKGKKRKESSNETLNDADVDNNIKETITSAVILKPPHGRPPKRHDKDEDKEVKPHQNFCSS
ncbi:hypothetical protein Trydic_g12154 [Trypoxylus dichotomus]